MTKNKLFYQKVSSGQNTVDTVKFRNKAGKVQAKSKVKKIQHSQTKEATRQKRQESLYMRVTKTIWQRSRERV